MRILQISSARTFGGGERHLVDLCRGLTARGHEVSVVLRPSNEWQARLLGFLPPENIFHASIRNSFGVFSAKRIAGFARARGAEIVHAHVARDYIPASLVCRVAKTPKFVLTRHVLFPMKPFHRMTLTNLERAIAVSHAAETNLLKIFPPEKITVIPNGIDGGRGGDEDEGDRQKWREAFRFLHDIPFDAPLVATVGELKILKGQRDFVLAASEISKRFPETRFVVVGRDHTAGQAFRRELKRLVKVFGLESSFLFLDWTDDLPELLAAIDVFVSASHTESFGLAILEAMTNRTAIVATATDGARALIENGVSGKLTAIKQPLELAEAVGELIENEMLRRRLAARAQAVAAEKFGLEKMIEATEKVYRDALRSGLPASKT